VTNRVTPIDDNNNIKVNRKVNIMKQYDVTAVHPETGREETFLMVSENTLVQNEHGETMFKYNSRVQWEVVSVKLVPQARVDATRKYFEKYGTANE
tara:strand:+ start:427 stop:714 length:288 start_codon:yes stop_codon:yes gene_type:complete